MLSCIKSFGVSGVGQSSPTLTRLYDAVGMTATPSTDTTEGSSDFDNFAPFNRRKCVGNWTAGTNKAVFNVQAYEGDADYAEDGSMGDYVAVEVEPFYYYDQDGTTLLHTEYVTNGGNGTWNGSPTKASTARSIRPVRRCLARFSREALT